MDPDAALDNIRRLIRSVREWDGRRSVAITAARGLELADAVEALDEWLCKDGFKPLDWRDHEGEHGF